MDIWVYERTQTAHRDTQAIVPPIDIEKSVTVTGAAANVFEYFISDIWGKYWLIGDVRMHILSGYVYSTGRRRGEN